MLKINELARLHLGVKGENESKTIEIDMSAWADLYPNGTAVLLHKRYGDATKELTGATYDSDTKILTWIPTSTDTYYEGWGVAEIRMMEGEVVKKTKDLIVTAVSPSVIDGTGTVIASTYQAWLDSVIAEKTASVAAKNAAEGYSEDAEAWAKGTRAGTDVESTDPAYENNAKYYAELAGDAKDDAVDAKEAAEDAQEAAETAQHAAEDAQEAAEAAQTGAQAAAGKYPEIGENHNWYVYNPVTQQYEDTGITARGISGVTPDLQIGTVETLDAGESATATITGTDEEPVLNLGIPKGYDGSGQISKIKMNGSELQVDEGEVDLGTVITSHQDITGKADKVNGGTSGNFAALDANGNLTDSGHKHADYVTDVSGKADKVSGGTTGNFASLDSSGNIADSGKKASDFVTDVSGKADKVSGGTSGNFASIDSSGNLADSGKKASDFVTDVSGKADKVAGATIGHFAALDGNGNLTDSGHQHSDYLTEHQDISGKLDKANVYNGMDKTAAGYALDARQGVTINTSIGSVRKGIGYVATMSGSDYKLPSGTDAAIGDYIWKGSYLGKATAAITGGTTVIVEDTNWVKVSEGAGNELKADKADKVSGATSGNLAGLDANGNLTDSGKAASDFEAAGKVAQLEGELDILISGNTASVNVTAGQYVTVRGSTISGVTDGIYRAANNVSSGSAFTSADLTAVTSGALNEIDAGAVHKTGDEAIDGIKTFEKIPSVKQDRYGAIRFINSNDNVHTFIQTDQGTTTNQTLNQIWFGEYSPKATADTSNTGKYERYNLPAPTAGLSANKTYEILTTKTIDSVTAETSSGGNITVTLPSAGIILSAWVNAGDRICLPFAQNSATASGRKTWYVKILNQSTMAPVTNTEYTLYYIYICP